MKFFKLIDSGIDVIPLLTEIQSQNRAWLLDTTRQDRIRVQRDTNSIFVRAQVRRPDLPANENQESRFTPVSKSFPHCVAFLEAFAKKMNAGLSRATIVRLKPNSSVLPHVDLGSYYFIRDRYHLVLYSTDGSRLTSGDEQVRMQPGELWWFNNKQYHEAHNESDEWRIHLIFDLLPMALADLAINPIKLHRDVPLETEIEVKQSVPVASRFLLWRAISERAVLHEENQRLLGRKGNNNSWLIDMRRIFMDAALLNAVVDLFWELLADQLPFQVCGMEMAAVPLVAAIVMSSAIRGTPVNGFIVRKERKTYGTGGLIEGVIGDEPIVVIDDILNSGGSLEKVRVVLEQKNKSLTLAFIVIDYRSAKGVAWRQHNGIAVHALFGLPEFGLTIRQPRRERPMALFRNVWNFAAADPNFFHRVPKSFPATDGKRVFFGSDCGTFWCLNAADGSVAWQFHVHARGHKNLWSAPALLKDKVFFGSYDGNVYCLDSEVGREVWRFIGADWVGSSPALAPDLNLLFIGLEFAVEGRRGSIVGLNLETGEKVWEHPTNRYTHASPAYWPEQQVVACGSNDNEMFLFDAPTGAMRWRFETKGEGGRKGSIRHAPAFDVARGHVITGCADGRIYVIDVESGKEVWSVRTDNTIYTVPLVSKDTAYVGSTDKYLYILDLERRQVRKKIFAGSKIFGPPRLLGGRVYFGACSGLIYEVDPASDEVTGTHQLPDAVTNALSYNAQTQHFYALTYVNQLFAFERIH
jgi:outer membrane protein assembly factor BamB/orotate phosphoribosyltransferase